MFVGSLLVSNLKILKKSPIRITTLKEGRLKLENRHTPNAVPYVPGTPTLGLYPPRALRAAATRASLLPAEH